jgi:hypothetical protein
VAHRQELKELEVELAVMAVLAEVDLVVLAAVALADTAATEVMEAVDLLMEPPVQVVAQVVALELLAQLVVLEVLEAV